MDAAGETEERTQFGRRDEEELLEVDDVGVQHQSRARGRGELSNSWSGEVVCDVRVVNLREEISGVSYDDQQGYLHQGREYRVGTVSPPGNSTVHRTRNASLRASDIDLLARWVELAPPWVSGPSEER